MARRMLLVPVDGPTQVVDVGEGFEGIREALGGGWIERVRVAGDWSLAVDEDGIAKGLPVNPRASILHGTPRHGHPVYGPALLGREADSMDGIDWVDTDPDALTSWLENALTERTP